MFTGTHDFSSFRSSNCNSRNPVKTVNNVDLKSHENFIIITVTANAFLQNMVRIMIGTLIDIAKYENNLSVKDILGKHDRSFAGKTASAKGLFFLGPKYNEIKTKTMENNLLDRFKI
jgi:tRNA pseudouridine38-40 synthase